MTFLLYEIFWDMCCVCDVYGINLISIQFQLLWRKWRETNVLVGNFYIKTAFSPLTNDVHITHPYYFPVYANQSEKNFSDISLDT